MNRTQTAAPDDRLTALLSARHAARPADIDLARSAGGQVVGRPVYPGARYSLGDIEPIAGMRASWRIELGVRDYIRQAREDGQSRHQAGIAFDLTPGGDPGREGTLAAQAAYTSAAGIPGTKTTLRYGRSFAWARNSCGQTIADCGTFDGSADDEPGHAGSCSHLSDTIPAWDGEWWAGQ